MNRGRVSTSSWSTEYTGRDPIGAGNSYVSSSPKGGGLDRPIELRERRVDHEAASAHRAAQSFRVARIELCRTGLRTLQTRGGSLREFPVHVGEDDLGDVITRAKVLSHHGTDRSAPDQENTRWVGGYAVEPRFQ